jgi:hypothetical protein
MVVGFQFQVNGLGKPAHIEMPTQFPKTSDQFVYPTKGRKTINLGPGLAPRSGAFIHPHILSTGLYSGE